MDEVDTVKGTLKIFAVGVAAVLTLATGFYGTVFMLTHGLLSLWLGAVGATILAIVLFTRHERRRRRLARVERWARAAVERGRGLQ